jgi:hypothetical protein
MILCGWISLFGYYFNIIQIRELKMCNLLNKPDTFVKTTK